MKTMKFGVAAADITPPVGVMLAGYGLRPSTSVGHPLRAEALACEGAAGGWILITADLCSFSWPLSSLVRADIAQRTGLPPEAVMLTASHTHSGPSVVSAVWSDRPAKEEDYFRALRGKLVEMADRAWRTRYPGALLAGHTEAPDLGCNRRVQKADGTWVNEWSDPEGRHTGYFDPAVDLVAVRRENGSLDALMVNYGCHPVCFGSRSLAISGDYPSYLKDDLEKGGDARTVLFTVSGHANIDPRDGVQDKPEVVRKMGEKLAGLVRRALPSLTPVAGAATAAIQEPWSFATGWKLDKELHLFFRHAACGAPVETAVSVLTAGSLALLGLPGETVSEYRAKFRRHSPFAQTMLVSLANDSVGYLPTDEILKQGAHEGMLCPLHPSEAALTARVEAALAWAQAAAR